MAIMRHRHLRGICLALPVLLVFSLCPAQSNAEVDFMAKLVARSFFQTLLSGEITSLLPLCAKEVNFDGRRVKGVAPISVRLRAMNKRARQHGLRLTRLTLLTWTEAVKRYGPPPARLGLRGRGRRVVALARFNTLGAAAILERVGPLWKVTAITD
jgi:hypothetical protein